MIHKYLLCVLKMLIQTLIFVFELLHFVQTQIVSLPKLYYANNIIQLHIFITLFLRISKNVLSLSKLFSDFQFVYLKNYIVYAQKFI